MEGLTSVLTSLLLFSDATSRSLVWSYLCLCRAPDSVIAPLVAGVVSSVDLALTQLFAHQCTGRFSRLLTITEGFQCVFDLTEQMHFFALGQTKRSKPQYMKLQSAAER